MAAHILAFDVSDCTDWSQLASLQINKTSLHATSPEIELADIASFMHRGCCGPFPADFDCLPLIVTVHLHRTLMPGCQCNVNTRSCQMAMFDF